MKRYQGRMIRRFAGNSLRTSCAILPRLILLIAGIGVIQSAPAFAAENIPTPFAGVDATRDEPVALQADAIDYDKLSRLIIAEGNVEISQGKTIVKADTLTYDQEADLVFAQGNVVVLEPTGNVYFADQVELTRGMKEGVVSKIRARLSDNSLFAADEAERKSETLTELLYAVYSPCSVLCDDGTTKEPLWQIKAEKAVIDQEAQEITYSNAYMDVFGVPILYTPYLSHATPGAENKSGLLAPQYRHDDNLGSVFEIPVYWAIAPDKDLTATFMSVSAEAPVLLGEYRQRFDSGTMKFVGSITRPDERDAAGNISRGNATRGHIFADGAFQLDQNWQWGFDINRTTDDTYLRRYDFNRDPLLTSRVFGEGYNFIGDSERSYVVAQALAFQGMQAQDDQDRSPLVLPQLDLFYQTLPMWANSRFSIEGGMMSLTRDLGTDSRRASVSGEWMIPYVTSNGHILEFATKLRADAYDVDNYTVSTGSSPINGTDSRVIPQVSASWRYPLINRFEESSLIVEPMVNAIASPTSGNPLGIPNEDSATPEFTDTNLFSENRFPGYDRVEVGPRVNYGIRTQWQFLDDKFFNALLGQTYRTDDAPLFPLSSDLSSRFSDYVGKVGMAFYPFDVTYRFRLDKDDMHIKRSELFSIINLTESSALSLNYLNLKDDPIITSREEISGGLSIRLADHWWWNSAGHRNLLQDEFISASTGLVFQNECLTVNTLLGRNYTQDRDFKQSTTFQVQLLLKNLN